MKTKLSETKHHVLLQIDPFDTSPDEPDDYVNDYIRVSKRRRLGDDTKWEPANINWSALGASLPELAEKFAEGLAHAVKEAHMMDERLDEEVDHELST
jgi:hypothetical protein